MKINDSNKAGASQIVQNQSFNVPTTPKLQTGVGSILDVFESSQSKSSSKVVESLLGSLKQSVSEANSEKKDYLQKLKEQNEAAESLSEYLETLVEASEQLSAKEKGKKEEEDPTISEKSTEGSAVREIAKKEEDPFKLKIVKRD